MAHPRSKHGSNRQELRSKAGLLLHRAYLTMLPEHWDFVQSQARVEGFSSASEYIGHIVATAKEENDAGNL